MHPNVLELVLAWDITLGLSQPDSGWLRAYLPHAPALDLDVSRPAPTVSRAVLTRPSLLYSAEHRTYLLCAHAWMDVHRLC